MSRSVISAFLLLSSVFLSAQTTETTDSLLKDLEHWKSIIAASNKTCSINNPPKYCVELDARASFDSGNPDLEYEWIFDGISRKKGDRVKHCFTRPGEHFAQLNSFDPDINYLSVEDTIVSLFLPPKLRFKEDGFLKILNLVTFHVGRYAEMNESYTYVWDFGDGQFAEGVDVNKVYLRVGTYTVKLYAIAKRGDSEVVLECTQEEFQVKINEEDVQE